MIKAATRWQTNADLIADVARLGYLDRGMRILDPTYGRGLWWRQWWPDRAIFKNDWNPEIKLTYSFDFRKFPSTWEDTFDAVTFDPPYVSTGGRKTSTIHDFNHRFGLTGAPTSPAGVQNMIQDGMAEAHRVLKRKGVLLVKCKNYVSSGKLWPGTHMTYENAARIGFNYVDELIMIGTPGAQSQTTQVHARQNTSTLFVFRKG